MKHSLKAWFLAFILSGCQFTVADFNREAIQPSSTSPKPSTVPSAQFAPTSPSPSVQPSVAPPLPSPLPTTPPPSALCQTECNVIQPPAIPLPPIESSPHPAITASPSVSAPVPVIPTPEPSSPFTASTEAERNDLQTYFPDLENMGEALDLETENQIFRDIFQSDQLQDLLPLELISDGGPLLFNEDSDFSTQAIRIFPPKAWQRKDRKQGAQRVFLRRVAPDRINMLVFHDISGQFVIDRDGTKENPTPGNKPIKERHIRRFQLKNSNGKWQVDAVSQGIILPQSPQIAILPKIDEVIISYPGANIEIQKPMQLVERQLVPTLPPGTKILIEARVRSQDTQHVPPAFVFLHDGTQRLPMKDNGKDGDRQMADGTFSVSITVPQPSNHPMLHLGIDAIATVTMADENTPNYQSVSWLLGFRLAP